MQSGSKAVVLDYTPVDAGRLEDVKVLKRLAAAYIDAINAVAEKYGLQRDFSLGVTKVQEASMWVTRGLTNPELA